MSKDSGKRRRSRAGHVAAADARYSIAMRHFVLSSCLAITCGWAGCATAPSGPAVHYAGQPFDLEQRPGRISGQVCGMDLMLDVQERPGSVQLTGFIDGSVSVELATHDEGDGRHVTGRIGSNAGASAVDVKLTPVALTGRVGFRYFDLHASTDPADDTLAGTMRISGAQDPGEAIVEGRSKLTALSPAVQAALVPTLLECNVQRIGQWRRSSLQVRVGGPPGALPHQSSALYTHD